MIAGEMGAIFAHIPISTLFNFLRFMLIHSIEKTLSITTRVA